MGSEYKNLNLDVESNGHGVRLNQAYRKNRATYKEIYANLRGLNFWKEVPLLSFQKYISSGSLIKTSAIDVQLAEKVDGQVI